MSMPFFPYLVEDSSQKTKITLYIVCQIVYFCVYNQAVRSETLEFHHFSDFFGGKDFFLKQDVGFTVTFSISQIHDIVSVTVH